ncbi:hypothetical protein DIPPA_09849 [Diplonema papillatum]|nr:hypothetical protein DIPPA_09849 [Diplonema papillatum]
MYKADAFNLQNPPAKQALPGLFSFLVMKLVEKFDGGSRQNRAALAVAGGGAVVYREV